MPTLLSQLPTLNPVPKETGDAANRRRHSQNWKLWCSLSFCSMIVLASHKKLARNSWLGLFFRWNSSRLAPFTYVQLSAAPKPTTFYLHRDELLARRSYDLPPKGSHDMSGILAGRTKSVEAIQVSDRHQIVQEHSRLLGSGRAGSCSVHLSRLF